MLGSLLFTDAQDGAARRAAEFTQLSGLMESMEHELTVEDMLTLTAEDDSELTTPRTEDTETFRWSGSSYEQAPVAGDDGAGAAMLKATASASRILGSRPRVTRDEKWATTAVHARSTHGSTLKPFRSRTQEMNLEEPIAAIHTGTVAATAT